VSDGLDDGIWQRSVAVVSAAHRRDAKAHAHGFLSWEELTVQERRRMELYIRYLLGHRLHQELRGDYAPSRLIAIAERIQPATDEVVKADVPVLAEVFRDALGVPAPDDTIHGVKTDLIASAALGVLLKDPAPELAAMRPELARYYAKHAVALRDLEESG